MQIPNEFNGYRADGRRLYFKGGDGGAGDARAQEEQRQSRITSATQRINAIFDGTGYNKGNNVATAYNPGQTYYDADGNQVAFGKTKVLKSPDMLADMEGRGTDNQYETVDDINAINKQIASGQLYTGRQAISPTTSRQSLYDDQKKAVYDINAHDVNKQYQEAERQNRFGLARNGLLGGSTDIDSNAQLQEKTNEGLMKATGIADQAAADLKTTDERARQSLISMAQSGVDTGTAQTMALRNLDANAQSAQAQRQGASIGGLFGDLSQAYLLRQAGIGQKAGAAPGQQWYGVSAPQQTYSGQTQS